MISKKYSTHLDMKKWSIWPNSAFFKFIFDASFYFLILLLLKVDKICSEPTDNLRQNISNFAESLVSALDQTTSDFPQLDTWSDVTERHPAIEQYAAKVTRLITMDPTLLTLDRNDSFFASRSANALRRNSIFNSEIIFDPETRKIEPADFSSAIDVRSLDMVNSGDSLIGNQAKRYKCVVDADDGIDCANLDGSENSPNSAVSDGTTSKLTDGPSKNSKSPVAKKEKVDKPKSTTETQPATDSENDFCKANNSGMDVTTEKGPDFNENFSEEEFKKAEKMTRCIPKDFNRGGFVCVCNKTYCDKLLPIRRLPAGKYSWYSSSRDGYRFRRLDGQLSRYTKHVKDAFNVNTALKSQKFIGFGGGFSDSASRNIQSLSQPARDQLLRSYYGPFGLEYILGRVPMGGTDFSPRFYTYMDIPKKFMLSEQDFKYKMPVLREVNEITHNNLKLIASSWTAPKWMKTNCSRHSGELKREYYQLYADYHVMFLENYIKQGIQFWALSTGNKPMIPYNYTEGPFINAMEWSPYTQSKWVNRNLAPTLRDSGYGHIELVIGDETREIILYYIKWFMEPLVGEKQNNLSTTIVNDAYFDVSGIGIQGYSDNYENEIFLHRLHQTYPNKFLLLVENACYGKPQLGSWTCAERYAKQMLDYFNLWTGGFIDWNLALDLEGGPSYLNSFLDAAIIVDHEKDEFYKQPMYYVVGHFSKFLAPDSVQVSLQPFNSTATGVAAIAAQRPDNGIVIVAYNRSPQAQNVTFVIDSEYTLSLNISAKSINSLIFWID